VLGRARPPCIRNIIPIYVDLAGRKTLAYTYIKKNSVYIVSRKKNTKRRIAGIIVDRGPNTRKNGKKKKALH